MVEYKFNLMSRIQIGLVILTLVFLFTSCVDTEKAADVDLGDDTRSVALPLINTKVKITDFEEKTETTNVSVNSDEEGRVTVTYIGEVVSRDWNVISPPLPFVPFLFEDSLSDIQILKPGGTLPLLVDEVINKLEFSEWNLRYQISHDFEEEITVTFYMPQVINDSGTFSTTLTIPYDGSPVSDYITQEIPLADYRFETVNNKFVVRYDARLADGTRVEFGPCLGAFLPFNPTYVEGYLGKDTFDVTGSIVPVDLFSTWKSGGVEFENPTIDVFVQNSLGLPLLAEIEVFSITTVDNNTFDIESDAIDNGIVLDYPTIAEKGETKITTFSFSKDNSNVKELFKQRLQRVNYDINAVYNNDESGNQSQFIGEGGAFSANVSVVIPLEGNINDLILVDTFDLDLDVGSYDEVIQAELKTIITNNFPLDLVLDVSFLNANDQEIDKLYGEPYMLAGATVDAQGKALPADSQISFTDISASRWDNLRSTKKVALTFRLNTISLSNSPLWVYDNYDVDVKMGIVLDLNINK